MEISWAFTNERRNKRGASTDRDQPGSVCFSQSARYDFQLSAPDQTTDRKSDMTENKKTVERYMEGFRRSDHAMVLSCLTDDVEWLIRGMFHIRGKEAFDKEIENEAFTGRPAIVITRVTEEADVVLAEGSVRAQKRDGGVLNAVFCDAFEMERGKIRKLISYLMEVKEPQ
jgi:ketosteroid isomerase-like protein